MSLPRTIGLFIHRKALLIHPCISLFASPLARADGQVSDWPNAEGAPGGRRYSPLRDITQANVKSLRVAWTYRHGDYWEGRFP